MPRLYWDASKPNGQRWSDTPPTMPEPSMPAPMVLRQITEFVSPLDNSVISTREQLKAHNKRNNVVDVGNDRPKKDRRPDKRQIKADTVEAYKKAAAGKAAKAETAGALDGKAVETRIINAQ